MKKRVLSLVMAFVLSFSMMPMSAFAEEAGAVTEQNGEDTAEVSNTGENTAEVSNTVEDISGNAVTKDTAVEAAQALINALPEEVTAENADELQAQLIAIDKAMAALDEEQRAELNMTRYEAICVALTTFVAAQDGTTHKSHPICGATTCEGHEDGNQHNVVEDWIPLSCNENGELLKGGEEVKPSGDAYKEYYLYDGNYYLAGDLKLNAVITFNGESSLCLNGHSITRETTGGAIRIPSSVNNNKSLSLCDCVNDGNGYITSKGGDGVAVGKSPFNMYGGIIKGCGKCGVSPNGTGGTFNMFGGEITANTGRGVTMKGTSAKATFNMYGGEISNNGGGGVKITKGTFTMSGGEIKGNSADEGGGVYADSDSTFTMSGGEITGNNTTRNSSGSVYVGSGSITVSGTAKIQNNWIDGIKDGSVYVEGDNDKAGNVYLPSGKTITIGDLGLAEGASIGVNYGGTIGDGTDATIATGANNGYSTDSITSDSGYNVWKVDDELRLTTASLQEHPICGGTCTDDSHSNEVWKGISALSQITSDGNYYLTDDVKLTNVWMCYYNVKLCLNGETITGVAGRCAIEVEKGYSLEITDCQDSTGKITHKPGDSGTGINVMSKLTLWNGIITGNSMSYGGGVQVGPGSTFIMNGGTITGNNASTDGGGVYLYPESSSFTMNGGEITGNNAGTDGGGVYIDAAPSGERGTFTVSGEVQITDNWKNGELNSEGIYVIGSNGEVGNVFLRRNATITIGAGLSEGAQIGVSKDKDSLDQGNVLKIATGATGMKYTDIFTSDVPDKYFITRDGEGNLYLGMHQHNWTYVQGADPRTIKAVCDVTGCPNSKGGMVTIGKPEHEVYGDGKPVDATLYKAEWQADEPSVTYRKGNDTLAEAPTDAGTYTASITIGGVTAWVDYTIDPKELTIKDVTVADKAYDGKTEATITDVTFNGLANSEFLTEGTDYTVTGSFADAAVGAGKEVTVKVELADSVKNYTLSGTEYKKSGCEISKATVADPAARDFTIINGNNGTTYTVELKKILLKLLESPREYGNCTYSKPQLQITDNNYAGMAIVRDDGMLALKITATGNTEGDIGTVTVTAETDNYTPITLKFNIKATAKILPQLDGTLTLSPAEITYGDKLESITISGTMKDDTTEVPGRFAWQDPTTVLTAGTHNDVAWKFTPTSSAIYAETTGTTTVKVNKALPTGAPKYTLITTEGKILADAGLTLTDSTLKPAEGKLEWMDEAGNVLSDDTKVKVNTIYWWRFTPANTNYDPLTGKVELYHVDAPAISAQPKSVSVTTGEKTTFEVTATGTDVTYQWKIDRNDGKGFVDITGATGAAYTTGVTDKDCNGFKYQCVISNAAGSVTTDTVVLTVKEKYTITATAGAHGSISPSGKVEVVEGSSQIFVITAEDGYEIESLTVDGKSVDAVTSYTFENVTAAHTIAVTFKLQYKIIDGANGSWTQSTDGSGSLLIRGNGEFSKFLNVKVDGNIIDPTNYEARSGSTIIELKAEYLKTLSEGTHTFEIAWTDGTASTGFTVAKNTSGSDDTGNNDNDDSNKDSNNDSSNNNSGSNNTAGSGDNTAQTLTGSPNTGDASGLWIALFMVSAAGLAVMLVRRKNSIKK